MHGEASRFSVGFAIALAVAVLHLLAPNPDVVPLSGDSATYHTLAKGVARMIREPDLIGEWISGRMEPAERESLGLDRWEFQHAIGLILPLGLVYAVLPSDVGGGRALAALLYAASGGLVLLVATRLAGRRLAWAALALYLLYLPFLYFGLGIATEGHSAFHVLLAAWSLLVFHRRPRPREALWLGIALALLALAKATYRPLVAGLLAGEIVWLLAGRRKRAAGRLAAGALVPLGLSVVAVAIAGMPLVPLGAYEDHALRTFRGNYVPDEGWETTGIGDAIGPELEEAEEALRTSDPDFSWADPGRGRIYSRALASAIRRYPLQWLGLVGEKAGLFWTYPARKTVVRTFAAAWPAPRALHLAAVPLALLGIASVFARRPGWWVPGALLLAATAMHACTHLVARYHVPLLALWFVYALLGAKSVAFAVRRAVRRRSSPPARAWLALAAAVVLWGAGRWLASPAFPGGPQGAWSAYMAGALLQGAALLVLGVSVAVWLRRSEPRRAARAWSIAAVALLYAIPVSGTLLADRDWDRFRVQLDDPGASLVQEIVLPAGTSVDEGPWAEAWLEIDMLRSLRGSFELEILVGEVQAAVFRDSLGGRYESALFDPRAHAAEERFRRVAERQRDFVEGYLNPLHGERSPGYDYFRRWVPVPVPLDLLRGDTVRVELRLTRAAGGAWVRVYGDRRLESPRAFSGPAMMGNPYEHSHYRVEFLAGDRERMDARLVRTRALASVASRAWLCPPRIRAEDPSRGCRVLNGEARVRLRCRLRGELVARPRDGGRAFPVWVSVRAPGDAPLDPRQLRQYQAWRDHFLDGTDVF